MSWIDRLLMRTPPEVVNEHEKDKEALNDLKTSFNNVQKRTNRLEQELQRVNAEIRNRLGHPR